MAMPRCRLPRHPDMRTLRLTSLWLLIGYLLVAAVVVTSLMPLPDSADSYNDKLLHLLAYLGLALWFGAIYRRERFAGVGLLLVTLGVLIECLQLGTDHRSFELADMLVDLLGTFTGLLLAATPLGGMLLLVERYLPRRG
jgi:VanZ family protein